MTQLLTLLAAGILLASTLLGAQAPGQQSPAEHPAKQQPPEPRSAPLTESKANQVMVSGCLKPGTSAGSFILTNSGPAAAGSSSPPAAQGTTGSTKSYTIVAKPGEDLSKHMNHKIEVTGTVSASKPSNVPPPETPSVAAPQPSETLTVQSFKMVAVACP